MLTTKTVIIDSELHAQLKQIVACKRGTTVQSLVVAALIEHIDAHYRPLLDAIASVKSVTEL